MRVLITGSTGLIGSELVLHFDARAAIVVGIDNDMRADFFGPEGSTRWNLARLRAATRHLRHYDVDVRDRVALARVFRDEGPFDLVIHCAAQPSHDLAARRPYDDFDVNATGTLNLLETCRQLSGDAVFVQMSTNKVYGDGPNEIPLVELATRWEYARPEDIDGITEEMRIDHVKHSVFGASKVAADVMTQEYGRYFGMRTHCLRGGCLTGPQHAGVELHGFLSYLVKTQLMGRTYRIFGYKGKQVRDNIHSHDVARAIEAIYNNPRSGEVYNLGGGRGNACSVLEALAMTERLTGRPMKYEYVDEARNGDHICYISNLARIRSHYPEWDITRSLDDIMHEIVDAWTARLGTGSLSSGATIEAPVIPGVEERARDLLSETLAQREAHRAWYLRHRDPIADDRMLWRAQTFRQLVHLLPGQSILELGAGDGTFTRQLARVTRAENPITAVHFGGSPDAPDLSTYPADAPVTRLDLTHFPGALAGRRFDLVVGMDLLDERACAALLQQVHDLLAPGGQVVFYESNPWNLLVRARRMLARAARGGDQRRLMSRTQLYELLSEIGFLRAFAVYTDFMYTPLTRPLVWLLRNLSIILENAPVVRTFAGAILLHAQKPPRAVARRRVSFPAPPALRGAVSVVIPCHNEEMNLRPLVEGLFEHYGEYLSEIIPVDDNSTDGTREEMRALAADNPRVRPVFRSPPNGVGRALADGYHAATGAWVLSIDCDFQHLLPELRDLFDAATEGFDVVVGSRFSRHSVLLNYPFQKILANRGFHALAQLVLRRRCRDVTNNLKLMRREIVQQLQLLEPGFAANAETGLQPLMMGARLVEVPISWINRTPEMGTSSFRLAKVGGGYWRVLRRLWWRAVTGRGAYATLPVSKTRTRSVTWRRGDAPAAAEPAR